MKKRIRYTGAQLTVAYRNGYLVGLVHGLAVAIVLAIIIVAACWVALPWP